MSTVTKVLKVLKDLESKGHGDVPVYVCRGSSGETDEVSFYGDVRVIDEEDLQYAAGGICDLEVGDIIVCGSVGS